MPIKRNFFRVETILGLGLGLGYLTSLRFTDLIGVPEILILISIIFLFLKNKEVFFLYNRNFENYIKNYERPLNLELFVESSNNEEEKLGALGALNLLFSEYSIKGPVFIAGGDNLSNFDLNQLVRIYQETKKDVIGLYDVEDLELAKIYGIAETNNESITDFHEKPSKPNQL